MCANKTNSITKLQNTAVVEVL